MKIPFGKPMIGQEELQAVQAVLEGDILVHGPRVGEFEALFASTTGAPQAIAVSSCTAGLHLVYFYLGIGPGDEVIVPAQTHTATAHAVEFCGAKPVFVDCILETGNIAIDKIEEHISERTRAISLVHFLGLPVDMEAISSIAQRHSLFIVEDCALAVGTYFNNKHAGLHGDVGCFSFYPVKHITTAEGGMVITKHQDLANRLAKQRAFGVDRPVEQRTIPGVYDVLMLGFNYRMNELEAAIGIEQLKKLPKILALREQNYKALHSGLKNIDEISILESSSQEHKSSHYCLSIILKKPLAEKRVQIVNFLRERGIGTSVYYPRPVPLMTYYRNKYGYRDGDFPNAETISNLSIALPVGPHLSEEDTSYITECLKSAVHMIRS